MITDLRIDDKAVREKYLTKLAEDILWSSFIHNTGPYPIVGEFIKKFGSRYNPLGMGELKRHHFDTAEWRIKKLLGHKKHSF